MSVDIPTEHTQKDILSKKEGEEKERERVKHGLTDNFKLE